MMKDGGSMITMTYAGSTRVMPNYKRDGRRQGGTGGERATTSPMITVRAEIRVNGLSAGPVRNTCGRGHRGFAVHVRPHSSAMRR